MLKLAENREEKLNQLLSELKRENLGTYMASFDPKYSNYPVFTSEPKPFMTTAMWRYEDLKKYAYRLRDVIDPEMTDRVTIHLENPGIKKLAPEFPAPSTPTMYGGIQIIGPKDKPPAHRHLTNAFRVGLEFPPEGGYTTVNGIRIKIQKGDVVLTPSMTWHDHGNYGNDYAFWYDGLDAPLTLWLGVEWYAFLKDIQGKLFQDVIGTEVDIEGKYSYNFLPVSEPKQEINPVWYYPYKKIKETLTMMAEKGKADPHRDVSLELINPQDGGPAFPTMSLRYYLIRPGVTTRPFQATESLIVFPVEGSGTVIVGDEQRKYSLKDHDFLTLPPWSKYQIVNESKEPLILFVQSDAPVYKKLGKYREMAY
ncbi:cupin domain-containing protein [Metallosphaera sedula]|uniref:cupin domain-containing protein n=1 Tax=Metallosphaera prunae TaxID=47304 RepID=UPI0018766505|nr:cupin domain-containing protein [Metallosphaera prunae]